MKKTAKNVVKRLLNKVIGVTSDKSGFENRWVDRPLWRPTDVLYNPPGAVIRQRKVNLGVKYEMENRYRELADKKKSDSGVNSAEHAEMKWIYESLLELNKHAAKIQKARDKAKLYPLHTNLQTGSYYVKAKRQGELI
jgi:hypothetical protein